MSLAGFKSVFIFPSLTTLALTLCAGISAAQDLQEPEQILEFGALWTYREGSVDAGRVWPLAVAGEPGPVDGWFEGSAPYLGRSRATQDEHEALQRRIHRQRRRRGRRYNPPEFEGTLLIYDPEEYPLPPGAEDDYEPGPNTYLFVTNFQVDDVDSAVTAFLEVRFSGGFVAYLNGREWIRHNLDPGHEIDDTADIVWQPDWVSQTVGNTWRRAFPGLDPTLLHEGENTLAIEVHRRGGGGMNPLYLDAQLRVYRERGFVKSPYLMHALPTGVTVGWETVENGLGYVEFGSSERLERVATEPRVASTGHEVRVRGLEVDTRYFYRVHTASVDENGSERLTSSPVYHFRTAPSAGEPFSFMVYGDNRTNLDAHRDLVRRMQSHGEQEGARFLINTGDLTTRGGVWDEWQHEFFVPALSMLAYFPVYPTPGNHEGNHESYYEYFDLPNNESWYRFSYGGVDFFSLNSNASLVTGSPQHDWLREALAASEGRWKIVFFHHPPFSCVPARKPGNAVIQEHVVPVLEEFDVDLVLLGHDHLYGRSVPINGVVYVITGGGGASTYPAEPDEINEICVPVHHYCILRVGLDSLQLEAISVDGDLLDTFTLANEATD